jgi:hypothetical protein
MLFIVLLCIFCAMTLKVWKQRISFTFVKNGMSRISIRVFNLNLIFFFLGEGGVAVGDIIVA